jgi:hypothetical protein
MEKAVSLLADDVSQQNPNSLRRTIRDGEQRVFELKGKITSVDNEFRRWAELHLTRLGGSNGILPIDLAKRVVESNSQFSWFRDRPKADEVPRIDDADIARARNARKRVGKDIKYAGVSLPTLNDLPDAATVAAIHEDLVTAARISSKSRSGDLPLLSLTTNDALTRAEALKSRIENLADAIKARTAEKWLTSIEVLITARRDHPSVSLFDRVQTLLNEAAEGYGRFLIKAVDVPTKALENIELLDEICVALERQASGKRPFPLVTISKTIARKLHSESWPGESEQGAKWIFCLTAARIAAYQERL